MKKTWAVLLLPALAAVGCGGPPRVWVNRDINRALVLVPLNESDDLEAPVKLLPHVEKEVTDHGWTLVPRADVIAFYEKNRFTDPGEMTMYSSAELAREFQADVVVWVNVARWGKRLKYNPLEHGNAQVGVALEASVQDAEGRELWKGFGEEDMSSSHQWFTGGLGVLYDLVKTAVVDCEAYAPGASKKCFLGMIRAGWDPKLTAEEIDRLREARRAPAPAPEPTPSR